MNFTALKLAYKSLIVKKTRSILTILGVSIGIAVVITIMSAGKGLNYMILSQLEVYSANTIDVEVKVPSVKKTSSENAMGMATGITITTLKDEDLDTVADHPNISAAYGYIVGQAVVKYQSENITAMIMGEGANMQEVEKFDIAEGRMYTEDEENSLAQVTVLGPAAAESLFGVESAVGKTVYIKGKPFRVVGVAEERGAVMGMDMDKLVYVPVKTMQKRIMGIDYYQAIIAKAIDREQIDETVEDLTIAIRENHDITDPDKDDFAVNTMEEAINMLSSVVSGLTLLLVALVCVSLLVGGVGIMNIMYVSVTERTFEIGLRKAIGAKSRDVLAQFLWEAILLTVAGGVIGIIFGALWSFVIYLIAAHFNYSWLYSVPLSSIFLAVGFSAVVGLVFGLYPAKKAAAMDPIVALRKE